MGFLVIIAPVAIILWAIGRHEMDTYFIGCFVGMFAAATIMFSRKAVIVLTSEGLTMKRCASINGIKQPALDLPWAEIEQVRMYKRTTATVTTSDGRQVDIKLQNLSRSVKATVWAYDYEEVVWRMQMYMRKCKASE